MEAGTDVGERYVLEGLIGKGGMAEVHRARDTLTGNVVALKMLSGDAGEPPRRSVELFEREFHTLVHFAHPRVVAVYDYGVHAGRPFYAMELLDGGDLQTLTPLPWPEVCIAAYEICSALALIHSRGLVHRDVTPRNIRRASDGRAKLIDFGLLSAMGATSLLAGTTPFVPPELMVTQSLDGRSDLFSLGATLYFVLTGQPPYAARTFEKLRDAWRSSPAVPSSLVPGVPPAVDELLLSLLRIDAGSRPKSAAEVMERLLPLLPEAPAKDLQIPRAYLTTPRLVGRDAVVDRFRKAVVGAVKRRGGGLAIVGDEGTGRSRMLDAFVLEAKLASAVTVRVSAADATVPFGAATALARQLHAASPGPSLAAASRDPKTRALLFGAAKTADEGAPFAELADLTALDRATAQAALRAWILACAEERPIAIAVDDVDEIDEPSVALLASLTWEARSRRLVYAVTLDRGEGGVDGRALSMLLGQAEEVRLSPLDAAEVRALLGSVFGDVPHLTLLADRLHAIGDGRPRECMALAQFLVDGGAITYASGSWTLPAEIAEGILPASIEGALQHRISRLSPLARRIAALLSSSLVGRLSRAEIAGLGGGTVAVDAALRELLSLRLITGDSSGYAPRNGGFGQLLTASLGDGEREGLHDDLARMHAAANAHPFVTAYHELLGSSPDAGLDRVLERTADSDARIYLVYLATGQIGAARTTRALELALDRAERTGRRQRDRQSLWVMLVGMSAQGGDDAFYYRVREAWLAQLKRDTGWDDWQAQDPSLDPATRAMMAVGAAVRRFADTPEDERVLAPPDAIKQLVAYVVFSIAIAARTCDVETVWAISELLAPFAPLNPMVAAMLENARATVLNSQGKREAAHAKFGEVLSRLGETAGVDLAYVDKVRASIAQTLGRIDVSLGIRSAWVERLEEERQDPNQLVSAQYLRKVAALQWGDWDAAEAFRQKAELCALQSNVTPMFSTLAEELAAHAMARELTGLKQVRAGVHAMAARHRGWTPISHLADAHYLRLCGDLDGALRSAEAALEVRFATLPRSPWMPEAHALAAEILAELKRPQDGLDLALPTLQLCEADGMRYWARTLSLAVAQCEVKLGRFDAAMARIERVISEQRALGVTGLQLGIAYEVGARTAIAMRDQEAFARLAAQAREQYRAAPGSVLGSLYERLMEDARIAGVASRSESAPSSGHVTLPTTVDQRSAFSRDKVTTAMAGCSGPRERAERALALLCDGDPPVRGHLFLISEHGLTRVASNVDCGSTTDLETFAEGVMNADIVADHDRTTALESVSEFGRWRDANGLHYGALLLGAMIDGNYLIGGIAVLSGGSSRLATIAPLAEAITRTLIGAGDTQAHGAA